jgi:hypothetical protein
MNRTVQAAAVLLGCCFIMPLHGKGMPSEVRLRDLELEGLIVETGSLTLTATFDVKRERIFDEVIFDFYLLLNPRDKELGPQFFHCRTVHRYLDEKTGLESGVALGRSVLEGINVRTDAKYAVVITYGGEAVAEENSEKERWWEDAGLGPPVENVLSRFADVPIVREWESASDR